VTNRWPGLFPGDAAREPVRRRREPRSVQDRHPEHAKRGIGARDEHYATRVRNARWHVAEKSPPAQKMERAYEDSFKQHSAGGLIVFDSPDIESTE